ncbi:MAG TPA: crotonase/enoyl-CoA hydratase family protein [Candidatus Bathyarchaeia archaeon]|nr:crotonase/enoyl-CoA hydratase family protein [Candidatus Bathyarchaeia archaeon]
MNEQNLEGRVTTEVRGRVFLMGLDRMAKLNGLTPKMFDELNAAYNELENNPELWVGVLFAHGKHTTAGLDLPKFVEAMKQGRDPFLTDGVDAFGLQKKCSKPMVCAVQGITFTAGIEMMLACDIVVAASDCRFSQLEPKRGITAAGGATFRFVQRCGWGNAMYHLLRADEFDAREAYRIGLVQEVVEPGRQVERAIEIAEEIAKLAPLAVQATKSSSRTYVEQGEAATISAFAEMQKRLAATQDASEGVALFKERREARFTGK